ncbi:MAG: phytase, partial [Longispora sp.]|nr:phytase [Longispora sp. (in: high G+C Gram-positive bacteria)]
MRSHPALLPVAASLLSAALLGAPVPANADVAHSPPHVSVTATTQTPLEYDDKAGGDADTDDPAIWVHPTTKSASLVVVTMKNAGLAVYDLKGHQVQRIAAPGKPAPESKPGRFNNVDLVYGFRLGHRTVDLALVSDRGRDRVRAYAIDPVALAQGRPPLTDVTAPDAPRVFSATEADVDEARTAYGLAAYSHKGGAYVVVSRRHETRLALLRLIAVNGKVSYRTRDTLDLPSTFTLPNGGIWMPCTEPGVDPQVEGMV